jgi:hypothetical protein
MNFLKSILCASAVIALLCLQAPPAQADSFNTTNTFNNAQSIVSWPTNQVGTNGIGALTGGPIDPRWNDTCAFTYQGYASALAGQSNQTGYIEFGFVRSWVDGPPVVKTNRNDWENSAAFTARVPINGAGLVTFGTNITKEMLQGANWLGIYYATNNTPYYSVTNSTPANSATNSLCLGQGAAINAKVQGVRLR